MSRRKQALPFKLQQGTGGEGEPLSETQYPTFDDLYDKDDDFLPLPPQEEEEEDPEDLSASATETTVTIATDANQSANEAMPETEGPCEGLSQNQPNKCLTENNSEVPDSSTSTSGATNRNQAAASSNSSMESKDSNNNADEARSPSTSRSSDDLTIDLSVKQGQSSDVTSVPGEVSSSSSASNHPARGNEGTTTKKKKRKKEVGANGDAAYPVKVHGRNRFNPDKMEAGPFPCQVCGEVFQAPHELTIHIRQHNMEDNSGSHTCKLCGKTLSSQSSLDRHMLVHSGERPFKCKVCKMAFTTNGNMNRHMRIHEKDGELPSPTPEPRQRTPSKRPYYDQDEDWSPRKKVSSLGRKSLMDGEKEGEDEKEPEQLACPICAKTFICRFGLQSHMETHPDTSVRCNLCHCAFRNHRGLSKHKAMVHKPKLKPSSSSSRSSSPSLNSNKAAVMGFQELGFTAFSSRKFPLIVKTWCENNEHKCNSALPKFVCQECGKSFPLPKALLLHRKEHGKSGVKKDVVTEDENDKSAFLKSLNLCPQGSVAPPKDEHIPLDFFTKVRDSEVVFPVPTNGLRHNTVPLSKLVPILPKPEPGAGVATPINRMTPGATADFADVQQMLKVASDATMLTAQPDASAKTNLKPLPPLHRIPVTPPHASPVVLRKQPPPPPLKYIPNAGSQMKGTGPAKIRPILPKPIQTSHTSSNNVKTMDGNAEESQPQSDSDKEELPEDVAHAKKGDMYVCEYCSEKFPLARAYKSHVRTHLGLAPYQCRQCNYASPDKSTLVRHLRTHNGERPFQCLLCQYAFTTKANCERHVRKKHNRFTKEDIEEVITYNQFVKDPSVGSAETFGSPDTICKYCGKDFRFFRALQHHLRSHSSCRKKPYQCRLCENGFSTKNNCIRHILKRHENVDQKKIDTYVKFQMRLKTESDDGGQTYDHDNVAPQSELNIKQEPLDYELDSAEGLSDQPLDFSMKGGRSTGSSHLASPVSLIIDAGDFEQPLDLSFKSTDDSRSESSLSQSASESAPTNTRKYRFKAEYHKYYNTDCDQLVCPMCPMKFSRGGRLEEHIRSHTKERPFQCPQCPSAFTIKSNLDRHMKNHGVTHPARGRGGNTRGGNTRGGNTRGGSTRGAKGPGRGRGGAVGGAPRGRGGRGRGGRGRGRKSSVVSTILTRARRFIPIAPKPISVTLTVANPTDDPADEKPSLNHSMASDSSGEFASVQNMLAATNPDNFQTFLHSPSPALDCDRDVQVNDPGNEEAEEMDASAGELDVSSDETQGVKKSSYSSSPNRVCCPHCPRTFPWESSLRRHLLTHTGQKPYKCPKCPMKFSTKSNRERHLLRKHNGKEKVEQKSEVSYQCRICEYNVFANKSNLHRHYVVKHPDTDLSTFPWDKVESELDESEESAAEQPLELPPKDSMESSLDSSLCLKEGDGLLAFHQKLSASTSEALAKAAEICDQISCDLPEEGKLIIDEKEDEPPKLGKKRKRAETDTASAAASTSSEKASPKQGKKQGKESKQEEEAQSAKKVKRTEVTCKVCGKEFQFMMTLTRHMRVHNLDHPFHCSICDAAFTTKFNCQRHIGRVHNVEHENTEAMVVERQEEAIADAESEADLDPDSQHAATNLVEDSDESFPLDAAQKAQSSSKRWQQSSSPVEIDSLSAKFESDEVTSNDGSVDLSNNPTTKRKQQCTICEKRFWSAQDLRRHMRSHTGERPFRCSGCDRTFSLKHSLVRHQRACSGLPENTHSPGRERTALDAMESTITEFFSPTDDGLDFVHDSYSDHSASNSFSVQDFSLKSTSEPITIDGLELDPSIMIVQPEDPPNDTFDLGAMDEGRLEDRRHPWDTDSDNGLDTSHNVYLVTPRDSKDILGSAAPDSDTLPSSTLGSDIIQNLLGIQDSSVIDQMLDSADSAARLLGVE